jgi:hypothetical protein
VEVVEIICIGVSGDRREVGGICYIEIEKDRRDNRALGDTSMDNSEFWVKTIVGAEGHPATQVTGQPSGDVVVEVGGGNLGNEQVDRDTVKCFGKVKGGYNSSGRRRVLVEAISYGSGNIK